VANWNGRTYLDAVIAETLRELDLNVDISTFRGWVRHLSGASDEIAAALREESSQVAQRLLAVLLEEAVPAATALRIVQKELLSRGLPVDEDELLMLRDMAYGANPD
jgi:hypothetical protein